MLHGTVRTLALECPDLRCRLLDLGPRLTDDEVVDELLAPQSPTAAETTGIADPTDAGAEVVALRRDRRWVRTERPYRPAGPSGAVLRPDGVYLITGGFGALGLELATGLARTGLRPRLALLGRHDPTADATRDGGRGEAVRATLAGLEALGAQVRTFAADVADPRAMCRVVDTVTARFGPVNGVFHLAGVAGDGMMLFRDPDAVREVLRPKVHGTLVLDELFADRPPLDLMVAFSSRAGLDGLLGSGDYAAANCFLAAHATLTTLARGRALALDWPAWARVGMAARRDAAAPAPDGVLVSESVIRPQDHPFLDEHRLRGVPVLPGSALVDLVYRAFLDLVPEPQRDGSVQLRDMVLRQVLVGEQPRSVRVELTPDGEGWQFAVRSRPADGGESVTHTTGEVRVVPKESTWLDVDALVDRMPFRQPPENLQGPHRLFAFGPRWQVTKELARPAEDDTVEKLVKLELPEAFRSDLDQYPLHPALLDTALSSARDHGRDGLALPFLYHSLTVHEPLPMRGFSHIVRRPASGNGMIVADVTVLTAEGRVVLDCEGFTLHPIGPDFSAVEATPAGTAPDTRPSPGEDGAAAGATGIDPAVGLTLLLDLLAARPRRHLAIRPFRDGRPVPPAGTVGLGVGVTGPATSVAPPAATVCPAPATAAIPAATPAPVTGPTRAGGEPEQAAAGEDLLARARRLWESVLGVSTLDPSDNFFDLGGNSLAAIDLLAMVGREFGVRLNVATLFDHPTLADLVTVLREELDG